VKPIADLLRFSRKIIAELLAQFRMEAALVRTDF
jgi:hypothetical protein